MARAAERGGERRALLLFPLLLLALPAAAARPPASFPSDVNGHSLHPPYFNLAEGTRISATATCGEEAAGAGSRRAVEDLYCKLVGGPVAGGDPNQTIQGQYCDICSSADSNKAHPITNAIDGTERWWQSPPLSRGLEFNQVNVTLDLGQLFHVAYVLIKFANSPRPDLWVLERSTDFGLTYEPWQYFASSKRDCIEKFGQHTVDRITRDDHAICTTEYSRIVPLENGEIVVSLVNGRPGAMNFSYSPLLRNFTKATNIRLRFLQTNTLLGHLMGKALRDPTVTRRYYYSIKDISIGGRCVCHGHADVCDAKDPNDPYRLQCDCQHNTCGGSCDRCCPGYHQFPWQPATLPSLCIPACNCNGHAYDCYYDPEVDRHKASRSREDKFEGGGVCIDCQHHTTGINCERCIPGYYRSPDHPIDSPYICYRCNCESDFTDGTCEDLTGRCYCKPNYTGEHCDACAEGYLNFPHCYRKWGAHIWEPTAPAAQGKVCGCSAVGTLPGGCDSAGNCFCRAEFAGPRCEQCSPGYHSYPHCYACQCSREGSLHGTCEQDTGQCSCRPKVTGLRCDSCVPGAYGFPHCQGSPFSLISWDIRSLGCPACDRCKPGYWNLTPENPYGCLSCKCDTKGTISRIAECRQGDGQCFCKANVCGQFCSACRDGYFNMENANYFGCQGCRCDVGGALGPSCEERSGACRCRQSTRGPTCTQPAHDHYVPDLHHLKFELEEGTTPAGRAVRFGYNPLEFEGFSWRGYAQMSSIQNKIRVTVDVKEAELYLFHVILRYINSGGATVYGKITAYQASYGKGQAAWKEIVFAPSTEPAFVTVPQNSFGEPFVLNPNTWSLVVEAEGVLLDYLVLLPSSYYEAPILQLKVSEPCVYQPAPEQLKCLMASGDRDCCGFSGRGCHITRCVSPLWQHKVYLIPAAQFTVEFIEPKVHCISVHEHKSAIIKKPSQLWVQASDMDVCLCSPVLGQAAVVFNSRIQTLGRYAFILHFYQPNHPTFPVEVLINGGRIWQGESQTNANFCPHGYGCRSLVVSEDQIILDVTDNDLTVVVRVPEGKQLWLDYILVVPEDSYTSQYLQEEPLDKSYDFLSSCGINSFYINPSTSSRFCRDSAISLSLFYNNGAQPCHCHEAGARGSQCQPFGGQCPCKSNVIGRQCSRCATGYWGFPNCRPCDCGTRLCDEVTGQCICPPHTLKPECVVCEPQTFGCHPLIGCEDCNCSRPGVQELAEPGCDVDSGQCRCKPNIIGRRCDLCAPGYYHYPDCRRCDCHQAGTEASVCDPVTGQCHCKENVEGLRCDQCRLGTFSLDATNPKGCTKCFCFGATDRCRSAEKHRAEFVDMNGWLLLSSDRHEVPTALSPREQLVTADLKNLPDAYQELYWVAPSSYLGDQVREWGTTLTSPGNQMSIMFLEGAYPSPGEAHEGRLQLVEGNFRHTETHNPVSREELMMVLANLEQLQIRALFSQLSSSVSLRRVVLEMATDTATGVRASNVELCFCPANYQGDSCQECAPGYYRDTKGLFLGKCIPCHCNGHSDQCLPGSGICLNCQHNTEGDHCERCKDGYMGSPSAQEPLHFAVGCVHKGSNMQCLCKPGYAGPNCERCAPGYFGNPLVIGSWCQPCDCSGNTDPNMLFSSCDSLTGACSGCMHHTAGARCELCAPGYYGDAVVVSLQAYEKLAARLDGAKLPLTERVKKFSPASSKIPIVEQAEEHARLLDELARNLSGLENRRNKNATVSENIVRIRQLITQARNAASKVKVPMKFNGSSGVQVRMPSNLQDLAAYTSLKFYIQNPEPRSQQGEAEDGRFVLYLGSQEATGDYLGIVLKDQRVHWIYKLGDEEAFAQGGQGLLLWGSPLALTIPPCCRILQYGHMSVIVERQRVHEIKGDSVAQGEQGLLNLDPHNVVFYVGGYPSSFTPPPALRYPNYRGCLELDTLNEEVVSLYNFQHTFELDTAAEKPCARWIKFESQFGTTKRFEQEIRVVSYNGIIFFLENQAGACSPGEPSSLTGWAGTSPGLLAGSHSSGQWGEERFGDLRAAWSRVSALCRASPRPRAAATTRTGCASCSPSPAQPGAPSASGGPRAAAGSSMRSQPPLGGGEPHPVPIPYKPGPGIMAWKHMEAVALITPCPCRSHFSLEVKLNSSSGLLFYVAGRRGSSMALFVSNGRFVFLVDIGRRRLRIRSKDKYRDRGWHTVFFSRDQSRAQLVIDGLRAQSAALATTGLFTAQTPLYVGGLPAGKAKVASASSFDGCLRNLQLDGRPLGPPSRTFGVTPCYEGALESGVFFATDGVMTEQDLEVTLEVRPRSASGLIFHIGTRRSHYLLLYMEETKVLGGASAGADEFSASVTCPALCDGQWHTIAGEVAAPLVLFLCSSSAQPTSLRGAQDNTGLLLPPLPHYEGCVRNLLINRRQVELPGAGTARGSVGLKGCPVL
uniref:Laminin subunit alpha 5 n=1 Tax=Cyanoderma ruficeps TaxID=181631 RepID=A0A8C3NNQ5_9PASS